jgi:putative restriction endonuclease
VSVDDDGWPGRGLSGDPVPSGTAPAAERGLYHARVDDDDALDAAVRSAAFQFLVGQGRLRGEPWPVVPRSVLAAGFAFEGRRVPLLGPQGIFKPAVLRVPLSITTVPHVEGRERPYEDEFGYSHLIYRYRGTDPGHPDNVGLRRAMERRVPLVYLHGLVPGRYLAVWPVFVVGDNPRELSFSIAIDEPSVLTGSGVTVVSEDEGRRSYALRMMRTRLHQAAFRLRVLGAYRAACAVCRLRHDELLDAAHILPDGHPRGAPVVPNGLALCKLHHAAFDANILGIRPDLAVEVRDDVLAETDGPMLLHGLQGIHGSRIWTPSQPRLRPAPPNLEERYEMYRAAG